MSATEPRTAPRPVRPRHGRRLLLAGVVAGLLVATGCSSSKQAASVPSTVGPQSTLPQSQGYTCDDPTGDIGKDVTGVGTLTEPAGIDLVTAAAQVEGTNLVVTYTTAGPIASVPEPFFDLFQGDASAPGLSFDLRTEPTGAGGAWVLSLGTTPAAGGQERFQALPVSVAVTGNTLTYTVPLSALPTIATLQWSFGATSTQPDSSVLFDDCSSIPSPTTGTSPPIVTVPTTAGG